MSFRRERAAAGVVTVALGLLLSAALVAPAHAASSPPFEFENFESRLMNVSGEEASPDRPGGIAPLPGQHHASTFTDPHEAGSEPFPYGDAKDIEAALPPGLIGDPLALPRCPHAAFSGNGELGCPADTQVGEDPPASPNSPTANRLPRLQPRPAARPARRARLPYAGRVHILIHFRLRTGEDYGLMAEVPDIAETDAIQLPP